MKKVIKFILIGIGAIAAIVIVGLIYITNFLPGIDAEDIKVEMTAERIARGDYLANHVTVCMDCHSLRAWDKFSGPIVTGSEGKGGEKFEREMGFPGNFYSPNITPFNLSGWTDGEIYRAIVSGVKRNGDPIFPLMPYLNYGQMDKEDIYSIIAYIRSLPSKESHPKTSEADFPMSLIMHMIPQEPKLSKKPDPSDKVAFGKYLVTAAACADCHTPFEAGQPVEEMTFAGGREFGLPFGALRAPNITPDKETGIGAWTEEMFVKRFTSYFPDSGYTHMDADMYKYNTIMPWTMYGGMKEDDLKAIYAYLHSIDPISNKVNTVDIAEE